MADVSDLIVRTLSPFVGTIVAEARVRATALSLGKTTDTLSAEDFPALARSIRQLLAPVAPEATITRVLSEIEEGLQ